MQCSDTFGQTHNQDAPLFIAPSWIIGNRNMKKDRVKVQPRLLTDVEVARYLGIGKSTFYRHRSALLSRGLTVHRVGRCIRYDLRSLDAIIDRAARRNEPLLIEPEQEMQNG